MRRQASLCSVVAAFKSVYKTASIGKTWAASRLYTAFSDKTHRLTWYSFGILPSLKTVRQSLRITPPFSRCPVRARVSRMRPCGWLGSPVYVSAKLHRRHYLDACLMGMVSHVYQDILIEEWDCDKRRTSSRVDRTEHCNQYVTLTSALRCDQDLARIGPRASPTGGNEKTSKTMGLSPSFFAGLD